MTHDSMTMCLGCASTFLLYYPLLLVVVRAFEMCARNVECASCMSLSRLQDPYLLTGRASTAQEALDALRLNITKRNTNLLTALSTSAHGFPLSDYTYLSMGVSVRVGFAISVERVHRNRERGVDRRRRALATRAEQRGPAL